MAQLKQIGMSIAPNYTPKKTVGEGLANLLLTGMDAAVKYDKEKKAEELEEEKKNKELSLIAMNDYKLKLREYKTKNNFDNITSDEQESLLGSFKAENEELYKSMIRTHQQSADESIAIEYDNANKTRNIENVNIGNNVIDSFVGSSDATTTDEHIQQVIESVRPLYKEGFDNVAFREKIQKGIIENQYSNIVKDSATMSDEELKKKYSVYGSITNRNITSKINGDIKKVRLDANINNAALLGYSKSYIMAKYPTAKPADIDKAIDSSVAKLLASGKYKGAIQLAKMHNVKINELEGIYSRLNGFKSSDTEEVGRAYDVYKNTKSMYIQDDKNALKLEAIEIVADITGLNLENQDGSTNGQAVADAIKIVEERKNETPVKISQEEIQDMEFDGWEFWQSDATDGERNMAIEFANQYMRYTINDKEAALEYAIEKVKDMRGADRDGLSKVTTDKDEIAGLKRHFSPQGDDSGVDINYMYGNKYMIKTEDGEGNTNTQIYTKTELQQTLTNVRNIETAKQSIANIALKDPDALRTYGNKASIAQMVGDSKKIQNFIKIEADKYEKEKGIKLSDKDRTLLINIIRTKLKVDAPSPLVSENYKNAKKQTSIQDIIYESYDEFNGLEDIETNNIDVKASIVQRKINNKNQEYKSTMIDDIKRSTAQNVADVVENAHNKILTTTTEQMSDDEIEQFMETPSGSMFKFVNTDKEAFTKNAYKKTETSENDLVEENLFRIEKDLQQVIGKDRANVLLKDVKKYKDDLIDYVKTDSGSLDDGSTQRTDIIKTANGKVVSHIEDMIANTVPPHIRAFAQDLFTNTNGTINTEKFFAKSEQKEILNLIKNSSMFKSGKKKGYINYSNYTEGLKDVQLKSEVGKQDKVSDAEYSIKRTLGSFNWHINKNNELIVEDEYNFNDAKKYRKMYPTNAAKLKHIMGLITEATTGDKVGTYGIMRRIGSLYGSEEGKGAKFMINLGKVN